MNCVMQYMNTCLILNPHVNIMNCMFKSEHINMHGEHIVSMHDQSWTEMSSSFGMRSSLSMRSSFSMQFIKILVPRLR